MNMLSKFEYFVLALFINSVASGPYYVPKISGHETLSHELNSPRSNDEVYLPQLEPSYMSPIPTKRYRKFIEDTIRDTRSLEDPSSVENHSIVTKYENDKKADDNIKANIPDYNYRQASFIPKYIGKVNQIQNNVAISTSSYSNPSSVVNKNKSVVNDFGSSSGSENDRRTNSRNKPLEILNPYKINNNQQPLRIHVQPEKRIVFQDAAVPELTNIESYHAARPAPPVNGFNINKEWTKISNEPGQLPEWIVERLKQPVNFHNIRHRTNTTPNGKFTGNHVQKILTDPKIQNVLASTKQIKRYMVIQPDGTVQHFEKLEDISAQHPDFVLVKAGQIRNQVKSEVTVTEKNLQEQPSQNPMTVQNEPISLDTTSSKLTDKQQEVVEKLYEKVTAVQTPPSTVGDEVTTSFVSPITQKVPSAIADVVLPSKSESETLVNVESENIEKETTKQENVDKEEEYNPVSSETLNADETSELIDKTDEKSSNISTVTTDVTATSEITSLREKTIAEADKTIISGEESPVTSDTIMNDDNNSTVQSIQKDEIIENSKASEVKDLDSSRCKKPVLLDTSDPEFWQKVNDGKDSNNVLLLLVNSEKDDSHFKHNDESTEVVQVNEDKETRSGKPTIFYTSEPDFWQKVSDWSDGSSVVFFIVDFGPKVEKNTESNASPDRSVLD